MKFLDRIALAVFSVLILLISIISCLVIFGWMDITTIYMIATHVLADKVTCNVLLGLNCVFILLAIKSIFFESAYKSEELYNDGVLLENDDGKLLITKETLVSMVNAVVSGFSSVKSSQAKVVLDNENNLSIILTIETTNNTVIKELSNNLQMRIKEKIKESLDLEVKNIDIRIKNVIDTNENSVKE